MILNVTRYCHNPSHITVALCDVKTSITAEQDDLRRQRRKQGVGGQGPERPLYPRDRAGPRQAVVQVRAQHHDLWLAPHPRRIGDRRLQLKRHITSHSVTVLSKKRCHNLKKCDALSQSDATSHYVTMQICDSTLSWCYSHKKCLYSKATISGCVYYTLAYFVLEKFLIGKV